jgi:hypothetical protein
MKYKILSLILFVNIFFCFSVEKAKDSINLVETPNIKLKLHKTNNQIDYKLLYETQKNYSSDIIATVYWALSSILVIILAIIGSNLFFNFKFNKKQYLELENELIQNINNIEKKLNEQINKQIENNKNELGTVFKENLIVSQNQQNLKTKELTDSYKERLNSYSDNLKEQVLTLKDRIELFQKESLESDKNINSTLSKKIEDLNSDFKKITNGLNKEIDDNSIDLQIATQGLEADIWRFKKVYANALTCYVSQTKLAVEINRKWQLKHTLRDIKEVLIKIDILDENDIREIEELYSIIPDEYKIQKSEIKKLVDNIPKEK